MKKIFRGGRLRKGISIVAAMMLLLSSIMPTVPVFADPAPEPTLKWYYIHDEASWNAAYAVENGPLQEYYTLNPDEDRWCDADGEGGNPGNYGQAKDKVDGEWPDYCVHSWKGAINATDAIYPWALVDLEKPFNGTISFSYNGGEEIYPWGKHITRTQGYGAASIPDEFKHMAWKVNEAGESSEDFDPTKLEVKLIPETLDYLTENEDWFYIYNESTWNAAYDAEHPDADLGDDSTYAKTPLHRYLDRNPDEDRWCDADGEGGNPGNYGQAKDKVDGEWPEYCVQSWQGAISATDARYPRIVLGDNSTTPVRHEGLLVFKYQGIDNGIKEEADAGWRLYWARSIPDDREGKDGLGWTQFLLDDGATSFDKSKLTVLLVTAQDTPITLEKAPEPVTYTVTLPEEGVVADVSSGLYGGETVTLTVTPAEHKHVATIKANDVDCTATETANVYTFTMPAEAVTVTVTFADDEPEVEELVDIQEGTTATGLPDGVSNDISQIEVVDNENNIQAGNADKVVIEQSEKATDTDEGSQTALQNKVTSDLVTSTSKKANILGIVDLTFWRVQALAAGGAKNEITSAITFSNPVKIRFKGLNRPAIIGVKHNEDVDGKYGTDLLVTQSNVDCTNIPDNVKYNGEAINPDNNGEVSIWTCGSSTFVAYEEVNNSSSGGSGGGGGGSSSYSCKNLPDNAVANNKTTPKSNTNYSYDTDTTKVCTFQCKSGYAWNEKDAKCELSESATTGDNTGVDSDTADNTDANNISDEDRAAADAQALKDGYSQEFIDAYNFARKNNITTMNTIREANMDAPLTRIAMAKMLSQYAINVLGKTPDTSIVVPTFPDVDAKLDADYNNGVTLAYQLGIMGIGIEKFRPFDLVTRAEFGTALSRMLFGLEDGEGNEWYSTHLAKLMEEKIITNDNPNLKELRGYVMIMLMRSAQ